MAAPSTLLLLCDCGTNIAGAIDLDAIAAWAAAEPGVIAVERHRLWCSPGGRQACLEALRRHGPERMVVAGCTPKMHEATFRALADEAGLNPAFVQIANIREHCAWVTPNAEVATAKARSLIRAALRRVGLAEALEARSMTANTDLLVIGGGVAGIETALLAAEAGRRVTLVERDIALGGQVIRTEEVAPSMTCSPCLLAPRLAEVRDHPNIAVLANAEVTRVVGFYGNFTATVNVRARAVTDACIGCEACFEACPVEVKSHFHLGLGTHKAIYTLFPGSVPAAAAIDRAGCRHFTSGDCAACVEACPFDAIDFEQADREVTVDVGAIVVATGIGLPAADGLPGRGLPNVYTLPEFERLASSNGPTGGRILTSGGEPPASVAVIHCAGSLCEGGLAYCSRTCCLSALKVGHLLRRQVPEAAVTDYYRDLVLTTPDEAEFCRLEQEAGTRLIRVDELSATEVTAHNGRLSVKAPGHEPLQVDMVVLATGLTSSPGTPELAELLQLELAPSGYPLPRHHLLHATGASLDGIYLAGCAAGPCDVASAITQAQATVGDVVSRLQPGRKIDLEMMTATIDHDRCAGCRLCVGVCPYHAIDYDAERHVCEVNEAICRGCGTCVASCPSGASSARHFTDPQLYAETEALLHV